MSWLTLDEQFFLLTLDPVSGGTRMGTGGAELLAGAALIEVARAGAVGVERQRLTPSGHHTLSRPHLHAVLDLLAASPRPYEPGRALRAVAKRGGSWERIGCSLAHRGVVHHEVTQVRRRRTSLFPVRDPGVAAYLRAHVGPVVTGANPVPVPLLRLLAGLLCRAGVVDHLIADDRSWGRAAMNRADALLTAPAVADGLPVHAARAQAAVISATISAHDAAITPGTWGT